MSASREALQRQLATLEGALPSLLDAHPDPVDFWLALSRRVVPIEAQAELEQASFVGECIDRMLLRVGIDADAPSLAH